MTNEDGAGTPTSRAVARVCDLMDRPLQAATNAGYTIVVPARDIVTAVLREIGDDAMLLPRYYERDEGQAWLLGPARHIDPDTGEPPNMYTTWRTRLPGGRLLVRIIEAATPAQATELDAVLDIGEDTKVEGATLIAEFTAAPDALAHPMRALLAACEHSAAGAKVSATDGAE